MFGKLFSLDETDLPPARFARAAAHPAEITRFTRNPFTFNHFDGFDLLETGTGLKRMQMQGNDSAAHSTHCARDSFEFVAIHFEKSVFSASESSGTAELV